MRHIIDLSLPLYPGMPKYPSPYQPHFEMEPMGVLARDGRSTRKIIIGSHTATHIDAPAHFIQGGPTIDQLPLSALTGPAKVLNLGPLGPGAVIKAEHLAPLFDEAKVERLLLCSSWSRFWGTPQYFKDWPALDHRAVDLIVERGVCLLGMDFPSPDIMGANRNHLALMEQDVVIIEYLNNVDKVGSSDVFLAALPLLLQGADGSPARVVAWWGSEEK